MKSSQINVISAHHILRYKMKRSSKTSKQFGPVIETNSNLAVVLQDFGPPDLFLSGLF